VRSIDRVGAIASAICAVHCVITGLALGLLSYAGLGFMGSPVADAAFLGVAVSIASIAIYHGRKVHHSYLPAAVFTLGLVSVVIGHFILPHDGSKLSTVFSVAGGLCFVGFHLLNMKMAATCGCDHCRTGE
jgi:hypothetical protein